MLQTAPDAERSAMITVDQAEAETRLRELLAKVEAGEEVVITRDGEPVARVAAVRPRAPATAKKALDVERVAANLSRFPAWSKDSATLIREMRDDERY